MGRRKIRKQESVLLAACRQEKAIMFVKSAAVAGILNYFFYRSLWAMLPLGFIGIMYYRMESGELALKKKNMAREQFKELLMLVSTGQKAGYSAENAFLSSYPDMKLLYGEDSIICRMLRVLITGRENNMDFSALWHQIGMETDIPEIQEFAAVYEISGKHSGNMAAVMEKTAGIIVGKMETEKEIEVLLSARKLEQKIMNAMPFLIMLYVNLTSPGYFDKLYHTLTGAAVMTVCLGIYLGAYVLSRKIAFVEL